MTAAGARGFTLVEILVALTLFALMGSVLMGSLRLAGRSWDTGEAKIAQVSEMRQTQVGTSALTGARRGARRRRAGARAAGLTAVRGAAAAAA